MAQILDAAGNALYPTVGDGYLANISIRHTVADAGASFVWACRNPVASTKTLHLRACRGRVTFDGTAVAAANSGYEWCRFTGGDPTTGTTVPRSKKRSAAAASQVLDANIQQKSGVLTITGITGIEIFNVVRMPMSVTNGIAPFDLDYVVSGLTREAVEFAPGEGFGIRLLAAAVIGLGIAGGFEWDER
jgi:hypothetical protein